MKIVVFADIHYFGGDIQTAVFNTDKKLVQYALPLLGKLTDIINDEYAADVCVNLGDLIQDMNDKKKDLECLRFMFENLKKIHCPCYSVLGNHDLKMMDTADEVESIMGCASTCSVDINGYHLVFLTTEVRPELGLARGGCYKAQYLSKQTLEWLKNDLAENKLPCLLFTHYGLAEDGDIPDACMFMKNRTDVKEIIRKDKNILAVFSGHQHITKTIEEDGLKYYVLGSLTACSKEPGIPEGVYFEVELSGRSVTVHERHIDMSEL